MLKERDDLAYIAYNYPFLYDVASGKILQNHNPSYLLQDVTATKELLKYDLSSVKTPEDAQKIAQQIAEDQKLKKEMKEDANAVHNPEAYAKEEKTEKKDKEQPNIAMIYANQGR